MGDRDVGSSFAIGFLLGAVVGVAIGFLYAPKPGKETRALLREKAAEVTEKAKEAASEVKKRVSSETRAQGQSSS
jgi:gas vesicle protein